VAQNPDKTWIQGAGFRRGAFDEIGPRKEWLDAVEAQRPVTIRSKDGHSLWVNSRALEIAGINAGTPDPTNGVIKRDPTTGQPSGLLQEAAMTLVTPHIPKPTLEEIKTSLLWLQQWLNREGITTALDAILEIDAPEDYQAYQELAEEGLLTVRYRGAWRILPDRDYRVDIERALALSQQFATPHFRTDAFKFFADEVIEEETAYLLAPYAHRPDSWRGLKDWDEAALQDAFARVHQAGGQVHVHAIGDGAVRYVLDVLEALHRTTNPVLWNRRPTLAHLQLVHPDDFRRMAEMDVTAVIAPYWCIIDDYFWELYVDYLGRERAFFQQYPQQRFLEHGVNLAFHSDFSVVEPDSMRAIYSAMTRRVPRRIFEHHYGRTPGYRYVAEPGTDLRYGDIGALPPEEECLDLEEALLAYTTGGAYANFLERDLGSITTGKLADLIVLDQNLYEIPIEDIPQARVVMTFFEGRIVFEDDGTLPKGDRPPLPERQP
jgi:predicted amidohydrolase YtcJ